MKQQAKQQAISIQGDWLAREPEAWLVRVPCPGGAGRFKFKDYGGSVGALNAARKFQDKAIRQLKADRQYFAKHGEKPEREVLRINNTSGVCGVCRIVSPRRFGPPVIIWIAAWPGPRDKRMSATFSTAQYSEPEAKRRAIQKRAEMMQHILLPTNS